MRPRLLVFSDFYLPGFKSGGGTWTVVNLVDRFADKYDFYIVTRNYDSKGDRQVYDSVQTDAWNQVGPAKVFYFRKGSLSLRKTADLIDEIRPDAVFLNSVFSMPVRQFLRARRNGAATEIPVILAPCGEMAEGALSVKPLKKKIFLRLALASGLYQGVIWKASFEAEADEIRRMIGADADVLVAPDLAPKSILPDFDPEWKPRKEPGSVRFAFFSRVVPKKNLKYLLERLCETTEGQIELDIIGPIEDLNYWTECKAVIDRLPPNVHITVAGSFPEQGDALRRLAASHFFAMPTLNENFGYVFLEALATGCPLLISDRTVWTDIDSDNVGWRVPLEDPAAFRDAIKQCVAMPDATYREMSGDARAYAEKWLASEDVDRANAKVIEHALERGRPKIAAR